MDNPLVDELIGDAPVVEWLLPNILPRGSLMCLAGLPGAGKSFLSYTLSFALATGTTILGQIPEHPIRVLYFDCENAKPDRVQYERWAWHGLDEPDLTLVEENLWVMPFVLGGKDWYDVALECVKEYSPDWMVFDTSTPCFAIENENDNGEANRAITGIRELMGWANGAGALVLKHAKIRAEDTDSGEVTYTLRGAKAWEGSVDGFIFHTKGRGRPRSDGLSTTFLTPGKTRAFGLRSPMVIRPSWTGTDREGLKLTAGSSKTAEFLEEK